MLVAVCVTLHSHFLLFYLSHPAPEPPSASSASQLHSGTTDGEGTVASRHLRGSADHRPPRHIAHNPLATPIFPKLHQHHQCRDHPSGLPCFHTHSQQCRWFYCHSGH